MDATANRTSVTRLKRTSRHGRGIVNGRIDGYPSPPHPSYHLSEIDQFQAESRPELVPRDDASREAHAHMLAMDATIYGLPSVYQYVQMHNQAVDRASPTYTGFDEFDHQREARTYES